MPTLLTKPQLGPADQGRKMSLKRFEFAQVQEGCLVELARGIIIVGEVPNLYHAYQIAFMRDCLGVYKTAHPGRIHIILGAMDSKLLIPEWESERHPDIAIYLSRPRGRKDRTIWRRWIPEITIEVV